MRQPEVQGGGPVAHIPFDEVGCGCGSKFRFTDQGSLHSLRVSVVHCHRGVRRKTAKILPVRNDENVRELSTAFSDSYRLAACFVDAQEFWILPGTTLDVFPCEEFVISGYNRVEMNTARSI